MDLKKLFTVFLAFLPAHSFAQSGDEISYETIVSELSRPSTIRTSGGIQISDDLFDNVKIHSGVGVMNSFVFIRSRTQGQIEGFLRGVQATVGIDLFSENWSAEGAIRSFGENQIEDATARLREFDLKIIYRSNPKRLMAFRGGIGLAARNLKLIENGIEENFTTPATILMIGMDTNLTETVSLGGEASYRSAVIEESADRASLDIAVKVDAHF